MFAELEDLIEFLIFQVFVCLFALVAYANAGFLLGGLGGGGGNGGGGGK